jgi:hypothetical protein
MRRLLPLVFLLACPKQAAPPAAAGPSQETLPTVPPDPAPEAWVGEVAPSYPWGIDDPAGVWATCAAGDADACGALAEAAWVSHAHSVVANDSGAGRVSPLRRAQAERLTELACEAGHLASCKPETERARRCVAGDTEDCARVVKWRHTNDLLQACTGGHEPACEGLRAKGFDDDLIGRTSLVDAGLAPSATGGGRVSGVTSHGRARATGLSNAMRHTRWGGPRQIVDDGWMILSGPPLWWRLPWAAEDPTSRVWLRGAWHPLDVPPTVGLPLRGGDHWLLALADADGAPAGLPLLDEATIATTPVALPDGALHAYDWGSDGGVTQVDGAAVWFDADGAVTASVGVSGTARRLARLGTDAYACVAGDLVRWPDGAVLGACDHVVALPDHDVVVALAKDTLNVVRGGTPTTVALRAFGQQSLHRSPEGDLVVASVDRGPAWLLSWREGPAAPVPLHPVAPIDWADLPETLPAQERYTLTADLGGRTRFLFRPPERPATDGRWRVPAGYAPFVVDSDDSGRVEVDVAPIPWRIVAVGDGVAGRGTLPTDARALSLRMSTENTHTGVVVRDGVPVAGAEVRATCASWGSREGDRLLFATTTDAEGRFSLTARRSCRVSAHHDGHAGVFDGREIPLSPGTLRLRVHDHQGRPVSRLSLTTQDGFHTATSDDDGVIDDPFLPADVAFSATEFAPLEDGRRRISVAGQRPHWVGARAVCATFPAEDRCFAVDTRDGHVVDTDGVPVPVEIEVAYLSGSWHHEETMRSAMAEPARLPLPSAHVRLRYDGVSLVDQDGALVVRERTATCSAAPERDEVVQDDGTALYRHRCPIRPRPAAPALGEPPRSPRGTWRSSPRRYDDVRAAAAAIATHGSRDAAAAAVDDPVIRELAKVTRSTTEVAAPHRLEVGDWVGPVGRAGWVTIDGRAQHVVFLDADTLVHRDTVWVR